MKVQATDEARIRKAGKLIDEQVRAYSEKFGIHDKQDLLAMVVFDCFVAPSSLGDTTNSDMQVLTDRINTLTRLIDEVFA